MEQYINLAKKLKALAEGGFDGEKYNAQKKLDMIMKKHNITKDMLDEDMRQWTNFKVTQKTSMLFTHIAISVTGIKGYRWRKLIRRKTIIQGLVSKVEEAEIRAKFNFYLRELNDLQKKTELAFIVKNNLFADDQEPSDISSMTREQREEAVIVLALARNMESSIFYKPLSSKE